MLSACHLSLLLPLLYINKNLNKVLIIAISLLHITLSQAGNIDKGFSIVDDSLKISVSSPQDKVIHVQVVPVGSQPGKSLIIPEISGPTSDCQVQKGDDFLSLIHI